MAIGVAPNYWTYPTVPNGLSAPAFSLPTPIVDSWSPTPPESLPNYSYSFPPMSWNASAPGPAWTPSWTACPTTYQISPIDYTVPYAQVQNTVLTDIFAQPAFPSTGYYQADPGWTQQMLQESNQEARDLEKQAEASQETRQTSWNKGWAAYSDSLGKQLDLDGKPVKG